MRVMVVQFDVIRWDAILFSRLTISDDFRCEGARTHLCPRFPGLGSWGTLGDSQSIGSFASMNASMNFKRAALSLAVASASVWIACGSDSTAREPTSAPATRVGAASDRAGSTSVGGATDEASRPASLAKTSKRNMNDPRQAFGIVKMDDGKVLVIGGIGPYGPFPLVEEYDPATDTWTTKARMLTSRAFIPAMRLQDGRILVMGGSGETGNLNSAEIYDPASDTWVQARRMLDNRGLHDAVVLDDGKVLVTGGMGLSGGALNTVEVYDPEVEDWYEAASLQFHRGSHESVRLRDGRILVAGGGDGAFVPVQQAEIYDPATGEWSSGGEMNSGRIALTLTLLEDGRVLAYGGEEFASAEIYDPDTNTWEALPDPGVPRQDHTATLLSSGRVLIAGGGTEQGTDEDTAEIFDPTINQFAPAGNMDAPRISHRAILLNDGRVMVIGGATRTGPYDSVEFYNADAGTWLSDPFLGSWERAAPLLQPRAGHTTTLLDDGTLLIAGGRARVDESDVGSLVGFISAVEIYDPSTGESRAAADMNGSRGGHVAALLGDGRVLVAGGRRLSIDEEGSRSIGFVASVEIYDPVADTWTRAADMDSPRWAHTITAMDDGSVLVVGGENEDGKVASAERYDPAADAWVEVSRMVDGRSGHSMEILPDGRLMVAGGSGPTVEVYDFTTREWSLLPNLDQRLRDAAVGVLLDGSIVVAGGFGSQGPVNTALFHTLGSNQWIYVDRLPETRISPTMTRLPDGGILMLGGTGTTKGWIFDGSTGSWLYAGKMFDSRKDHTATLLPDGRVVAIGGEARNRVILNSVEIYTPESVR